MALHIRNERTERLVRELAKSEGLGLTQAIEFAVESQLRRKPVRERIRLLQERLAAIPDSGLKADKEFYDSLNDE